MKDKPELIREVETLIAPLVLPHVPEGTEAQAVIDQWVHAIATDSEFYCDPSLTPPILLKEKVISLLTENKTYQTRELFFDVVFGEQSLKPVKDATFKFIDLFAGIGGVRLGFQKAGGTCFFFVRV